MTDTLNKVALKATVKKIKAQVYIIAKARDELRIVYDELEEILESSDRGIDSIHDGIDALSEYL